ncbi:MAG: GspE/PulE family protein [Patescibacteria group bacterium]|nr:GspE/PulE family protein [Patescibacteria group bacterium]
MIDLTGKIQISKKRAEAIKKKVVAIDSFKKEIEKNLKQEVTELIEVILSGAIYFAASDIHFEPQEKEVKMRIRLDGMLHDVIFLPHDIYRFLLSRIKLLAGLKLNVHNKPQDGNFEVILPLSGKTDQAIEIRTSSLPADFGESIVMRILNPESLKSIEELGLRNDLAELFKKEIQKPNGMIIITGPTGSGKTTTLYAFLKYIQKPEIKIITIEDPIEYRLKGASQTEVDAKKGYDFASGLRSIVRQDPDVILVGEVRDIETAKISLQAALTGHLVFSTLHTNDAAGAIPRLTSIGADVINIGPAINMVVAQRLVRKVCKECSVSRPATAEEKEKIKKELNNVPKPILSGIDISGEINLPKIKGCKACNFTGYKGRVGIFETFLITDEVEALILKNPAIFEIKELISKNGTLYMRQDGLMKVLKGITTIEEIDRVTGE